MIRGTHMHGKTNQHIIPDRAAALFAILCTAAYEYGLRIWMLAVIAAAVSLLTERVCLSVRKKQFHRQNTDAAVSGIVLLLLLPPSVSVSLLIMSCIFAIIIGRQLFGGKENPVIPSAAAGYCFAFLNQRAQVTLFPAEKIRLPLLNPDTDTLIGGISDAFNKTGAFTAKTTDWLLGLPNQPIGTCSAVMLAVAALVLICRRSASGWVLLPMLFFTVSGNMLFDNMRHPMQAAVGTLLTNQFFFAAVFLYADPDYAPPTAAGILYGILCAGVNILFTRVLYVADAPVFLVILMTPAALWLRYMMEREDAPAEQKGGGSSEAKKRKKIRHVPKPDSP